MSLFNIKYKHETVFHYGDDAIGQSNTQTFVILRRILLASLDVRGSIFRMPPMYLQLTVTRSDILLRI